MTSHSPLITSSNNFKAASAKRIMFSVRSFEPVSTSLVKVPSGVATARATYPLLIYQSLRRQYSNYCDMKMQSQEYLRRSVPRISACWTGSPGLADCIRATQLRAHVLSKLLDDGGSWAGVVVGVRLGPSSKGCARWECVKRQSTSIDFACSGGAEKRSGDDATSCLTSC